MHVPIARPWRSVALATCVSGVVFAIVAWLLGGRRPAGGRASASPSSPWPSAWPAPRSPIGGSRTATKNVLARTLHPRTARPSGVRGRAFAAFNGLRNGAELVALTLGGVAISALGARWTLLYAGAVPVSRRRAGSCGCGRGRSARRSRFRAGACSERPALGRLGERQRRLGRGWVSAAVVGSGRNCIEPSACWGIVALADHAPGARRPRRGLIGRLARSTFPQ